MALNLLQPERSILAELDSIPIEFHMSSESVKPSDHPSLESDSETNIELKNFKRGSLSRM